MLENYQVINESGAPRFAILDFSEFIKIKELLSDYNKLEDYMDYMHIQKIKKKKEKSYSLEEVKKELNLI